MAKTKKGKKGNSNTKDDNIDTTKDDQPKPETPPSKQEKPASAAKGKKGKGGGKKGVSKTDEYERKREEQEKQEALKKELRAAAKLKAKLRLEKERKEAEQHEIRKYVLLQSCQMLKQFIQDKSARAYEIRQSEEWAWYLKCDGLPDLNKVDEMSYYQYQWEHSPIPRTLADALPRFEEALTLINRISDYIRNPLNAPKSLKKLWKFVRQRLYRQFSKTINGLTFYLLRDIKNTLEQISPREGRIEKQTRSFAFGLYSRYHDVIPCISETDDLYELPVIIDFPTLQISVHVPYQVTYEKYVLRVLWSKFDDFSILTNTYEAVPMPEKYKRDLYEWNQCMNKIKEKLKAEYETQMKLKNKQRKIDQKVVAETKQGEIQSAVTETQGVSNMDEESLDRESKASSVYINAPSPERNNRGKNLVKTPSEMLQHFEENEMKELVNALQQKIAATSILNLRKYKVLGGIFHVQYFEPLPQPHILPDYTYTQIITGDRVVKPMSINMNTTHIIKPVYNKYRDRMVLVQEPADTSQEGEERKSRSSHQLYGGEESGSISVQQDKKPKLVENLQPDRVSTERIERKSDQLEKQDEIENKQNDTKPSNVSSSENAEAQENKNSVLEEQSSTSITSHDSMFEEFILEEHEPFNFKPKITLKLPKHVLWLDKPIPIIWNHKLSAWQYNNPRLVFDITYEENEGIIEGISFRYARIDSPVALAVKRYAQLPFRMWKLYPVLTDSSVENVILELETHDISLEIKIGANVVCLNSINIRLPNQNQNLLNDLIGVTCRPIELIKKITRSGIDIFPEDDSFINLRKIKPKHYITERHTYQCMALTCLTHSFQWSKWNRLTASQRIVINIKETSPCQEEREFILCLITPYQSLYLEMNEDGKSFTDKGLSEKFHPDLYSVLLDNSCTISRIKIKNATPLLVDSVYVMLTKTKILSYS